MPQGAAAPVRAAQYIRMSTERQTYSLEYQAECNAGYARERGFELVRTYADEGVSGLRLNGRAGLKQLLADVIDGRADFRVVLVYDVSRWGRFQDLDQGAHYEFLCREAGVQVVYTAEPFAADGSLAATIIKHLKRAMAAEYSRDLSAKIHRAQVGLRAKGYWQGGPPGYGLRRLAVTSAREPHLRMEAGEHKAVRSDRTLLVLGPADEVETVRRIYRLFVVDGLRIVSIVRLLNQEGVPAETGARWTLQRVRQVLTAEKYAGVLVGAKSEGGLDGRRARRRADWVRIEGAVEPLIPRSLFDLAQTQFRKPKARGASDEELLAELRLVLAERGRLSHALIDGHPGAHCSEVYKRRFGSMEAAYARIGYQPSRRQTAAAALARRHRPDTFRSRPEWIDRDAAFERLKAHYATFGRVSCNTIDDDAGLPSSEWYRRQFGGMARLYAMLGYEPSERQRLHLERHRADARPYRRPS